MKLVQERIDAEKKVVELQVIHSDFKRQMASAQELVEVLLNEKNQLEGKLVLSEMNKESLESDLKVEKEKSCALKDELNQQVKLVQQMIESEERLQRENEELRVESSKIVDQLKICEDELVQNNEHLEEMKFEAQASASKLKQQKKNLGKERDMKM